jgi:hypothetical protein
VGNERRYDAVASSLDGVGSEVDGGHSKPCPSPRFRLRAIVPAPSESPYIAKKALRVSLTLSGAARSTTSIAAEREALTSSVEPHYGGVRRYTRAAVPLYSAIFSAADAPDVTRLNAFQSSV